MKLLEHFLTLNKDDNAENSVYLSLYQSLEDEELLIIFEMLLLDRSLSTEFRQNISFAILKYQSHSRDIINAC